MPLIARETRDHGMCDFEISGGAIEGQDEAIQAIFFSSAISSS